jgi:hypothetical protein
MFPGLLRHLVSLILEKPKGVPRVTPKCDLAPGPGQSSFSLLGMDSDYGVEDLIFRDSIERSHRIMECCHRALVGRCA